MLYMNLIVEDFALNTALHRHQENYRDATGTLNRVG